MTETQESKLNEGMVTLKPSEVTEELETCVRIKRPLFIWGAPGVGKSSVVKQVGDRLNRKVRDVRLTLLDSVDLRGFPYRDGDTMRFSTPAFLPTDPDSTDILFMDELNAADPSVQAAAYQLILDRQLGEYKLPENVSLVAAGNRETDAAPVHTMAAPLANRFIHCEYRVDLDDWRKWALKNGIHPEILSFISFKPDMLNRFDPDASSFPTPRTWEYASDIISDEASVGLHRKMLSGTIGNGATTEFHMYQKIYKNLPDPDAVLAAPDTAVVPTELGTLYALCGALAHRATRKNMTNFIKFCSRLAPEFQVLAVRDACVRDAELLDTAAFTNWSVTQSDFVL